MYIYVYIYMFPHAKYWEATPYWWTRVYLEDRSTHIALDVHCLVVEPTPLKNMSSSVGVTIPNMMGKI